MINYDKEKINEIKNSLTIEQVYQLVLELGGEPILKNNYFISKTICHNPAGYGSYKLYYYDNTKLFRCYTDCGEYFDIYELVQKQKSISDDIEWSLFKAIYFVLKYFNFPIEIFDFNDEDENNVKLSDWSILDKYEENKVEKRKQKAELTFYDESILTYLPKPIIIPWENEGISRDVIKSRNIAYDPKAQGIVIPHYDINDNLIGIRERTLIKEEEKNGKYKPALLNNQMYNHPLSFNLYNINKSKNNIKLMKKVIVFEGEKSPLLYVSYFGEDNDISVACCGSSLVTYQVQLLLSLGVEEIIIAFDKQFKELNDDEHKRWVKKLKGIHEKYSMYVQISFLFDKWNLLRYKDSPIDRGKEIFLELYNRRIML